MHDYDLIADPKARRKAKRKLMIDQVKKPELKELDTRKSLFSGVYPGSSEADWTNYEGLGWLHKLERFSFQDNCVQCSVSKKWMWKKDAVITEEDGYISLTEAEANWVKCPYLGRYVKNGTLVPAMDVDGKKIQVSQYAFANKFFKCDFSGDYYCKNTRIQVKGSDKYKNIAHRFVKEHFAGCASCGNVFIPAMVKNRPDLALHLCDQCYVKHVHKNVIHKHDYAEYPKPICTPKERYGHKVVDGRVVSTKKKETYNDIRNFGVEVELELYLDGCKRNGLTRHHMAINIMKAVGMDFVICKEDGTLTMNGKYSGGAELDPHGTGPTYAGFEVVSAPADLETHRNRWPKLELAEGFKHLRAWDTDTCGFHVHVTREALTYLQIARMLIFVNHPKNTLFIQKIAGRGSAKFCRYVEKEPKDALRIDPRTDENRRQAINLCNEKTVEFRIFRGTVNPKHILRNIEFCDAICDFSYPASRSLKELYDYKNFVRFVDANRKKWPLLAGWFGLHKMLSMKLVSKKADKDKLTLKEGDVTECEIKVDVPKEPKKERPMRAVRAAELAVANPFADDDDD